MFKFARIHYILAYISIQRVVYFIETYFCLYCVYITITMYSCRYNTMYNTVLIAIKLFEYITFVIIYHVYITEEAFIFTPCFVTSCHFLFLSLPLALKELVNTLNWVAT